ncbi:hypothetical protein ACWF95_37030 [Streptomyces vinaceus]
MQVHLRFDGGLHQVPGELDQQASLAHQPQTTVADLAGGGLGQLIHQRGAQPVRCRGFPARRRHLRCHTGTVNAIAHHRNRHAVSVLDQVTEPPRVEWRLESVKGPSHGTSLLLSR